MSSSNPSESELMKSLLEPLLDDFQYWFGRSRALLESREIEFLGSEQQAELLAKVQTAQQEVSAMTALFYATEGQAGMQTSMMASWHKLVHDCWQVSMRLRQQDSTKKEM